MTESESITGHQRIFRSLLSGYKIDLIIPDY